MSTSAETIHVAGAGIGGLATAVALHRQGLPVVVHDRAPELTPVGAGLSLWPNAVLALESLGVTGIRGGTIPRGGAGLYRWDGEPLATDAGEAIEQRYGAPLVLLHRAELQQALLDALAPGSLRLGEALESFTQDERRVSLRLAGGGTASGPLLVGADGLRSTGRAELFGDEPPRDSGLVAHRGVVALDDPPLAGELWGADGVVGIAPLSGGRVYWYATQRAVPDALRAYEQARRKRAAMLVKRSRVAGRVAHMQSRWKRALRDALVHHTPESARYRQLDAAIGRS
jgi:2-polyprenyl-6-methoxyphenol hydroxylase-like FAD-dependent oxidoreductase